MPPTALTYRPMSLRCLTFGSGRGGVMAGRSGGSKPAPPDLLTTTIPSASAPSATYTRHAVSPCQLFVAKENINNVSGGDKGIGYGGIYRGGSADPSAKRRIDDEWDEEELW